MLREAGSGAARFPQHSPPPPPAFGLNIVWRTQSRGRGKGVGVTRINGPFGTQTQAEPGPSLDQGDVLKIEVGNEFLSCKHR